MFEQDYIKRQIKECVAAVMKILFNKEYDTPASVQFQSREKQTLSDKIRNDIDSGNITDAITYMYQNTSDKTFDDLIIGMVIYTHLCDKGTDFLNSRSFSITDVKQSAKDFFSRFEIADISDLIFFDL